MVKALVLAGNSFIGRHVVDRLRQEGVETAATSRRPASGYLPCDLTNVEEVDRIVAVTAPDWIVQCAGATTSGSRADMDRLHVDGTRHLLQAVARRVPEASVLLFGSAAEYGNVPAAALPVGEDYPAEPQSAFGQSKLAQTRLAARVAEENHLRVGLLRPFNVVGPDVPDHYLAGALARRLLEALAANQSGAFPVENARATRDWVDVRDVAEAAISLLNLGVPAGCALVYNVATGIETPVLAVAEELCRRTGVFTAVAGGEGQGRSGVLRSCGDSGRLRAAGWQPRIPWQQSMADLWNAGRPRICA